MPKSCSKLGLCGQNLWFPWSIWCLYQKTGKFLLSFDKAPCKAAVRDDAKQYMLWNMKYNSCIAVRMNLNLIKDQGNPGQDPTKTKVLVAPGNSFWSSVEVQCTVCGKQNKIVQFLITMSAKIPKTKAKICQSLNLKIQGWINPSVFLLSRTQGVLLLLQISK